MITDEHIIDRILLFEGIAYTNHPHDAGGPTKYGITLVNLSNWRGHLCTVDDVKNLSRDEASAIYRVQYIRPFDIVQPDALRVNVIDMGVNAGLYRAAVLLQQLVGVTADGWPGPVTLRALSSFPYDANLLYVGFRLQFYESLIAKKPSNAEWRSGWRRRALSFTSDTLPKTFTKGANFVMAKAA